MFGYGIVAVLGLTIQIQQMDAAENPSRLARKHDSQGLVELEVVRSKQLSLWDVDNHLAEISADGVPLEKLSATVDFDRFRPIFEKAAGHPHGAKSGRPALDVVLKFKMLVLQSLHGLSLEATEHMVRDRQGLLLLSENSPRVLK